MKKMVKKIRKKLSAIEKKDKAVTGREIKATGRESAVTGREIKATGREEIVGKREEAVGKREQALTGREEAVGKRERIKKGEGREGIALEREEAVGIRERVEKGREIKATGREEIVGKREHITTGREEAVGKREQALTGREEIVGKRERIKKGEGREGIALEREEAVGKREQALTGREEIVGIREAVAKRREEIDERYRVIFSFSSDAIMTLEPPNWKFTSGNPAAIKIFNVKDEKEFISLGLVDLSPEKQPDSKLSLIKAKKMIEKAMKEGSNFFEWILKRYNGESFPATILLSRVEEEGKAYLQATIRDITELKKAEEKLKELDAAKTEFMNIVSHELKTPLTAIYANLELLEEAKDKLSEKNVNNLNALRRNSNQLRFFIDNILEISRIQSNKFVLNISETDLGDCIKYVENDLKVLADKKNIKLTIEMGKPINMSTDEIRLKEILTNLIDNAIKFTEKGYIKIKVRKQEDNILVEVIDTGIGISKDKSSRLFEKFYQISTASKSEVGGTGLGLSITKQLVELLGGKINFKSKLGKGSTFYFTLPIKYKKEVKLKREG